MHLLPLVTCSFAITGLSDRTSLICTASVGSGPSSLPSVIRNNSLYYSIKRANYMLSFLINVRVINLIANLWRVCLAWVSQGKPFAWCLSQKGGFPAELLQLNLWPTLHQQDSSSVFKRYNVIYCTHHTMNITICCIIYILPSESYKQARLNCSIHSLLHGLTRIQNV